MPEALAGPSEQRGAAETATEEGSVEQQQTIGRCMTSIAVHVDAGLRTPSVELAHEEDNDDDEHQQEEEQQQQEPTECAAHDVLPGSPPRPCPSPRPGPGGTAGAPDPEEKEPHHQVLNSGWAVEPFDEADDSAYSTRDETDEMEESGGGGGSTREEVYCTYVVCVDLRGLVPSWVVNRFQARDVHAAFARLKQQAEDHHHRATTTATPPPPPQQQQP